MEAQVAVAIDELLGQDPEALDDEALQVAVVALERLSSRFAAARARFTSVWDSRTVWAGDGSRAAGVRLARDARCSPVTGRAEVRRARALRSMPLVRAAFEAGEISTDHVDVLIKANHDPITTQFAHGEAMLVEQAQTLDFDLFERFVKHWRNAADDDSAEDRAQRAFQDRYLRAAKTYDDVVDLQGRLDPIGGAIFTGELERIEHELFEADWNDAKGIHGDDTRPEHLARTSAQRRADAIVVMAKRSAAMPADAKQARILISVLVGYETFKGRVCELMDGTVLTPGQVTAVLAESDIERIVFDTISRVIDVGARQRFFTGGLRRAIEVRDRHCTGPSCTVPAERCEVDHIIEHCDGGLTTQANGRLRCGPHNRQRPGRSSPPAEGP